MNTYSTPIGTGVNFSLTPTLADGVTPATFNGATPTIQNSLPSIATAVIDPSTGLLKVTPTGTVGSTIITATVVVGGVYVVGNITFNVTTSTLPNAEIIVFTVESKFTV